MPSRPPSPPSLPSPASSSAALEALISLMRDPDPGVWRSVEAQLLSRGEETKGLLREAAQRGEDTLERRRARETLAKIHEGTLTDRLARWVNPGGPEPDLEEGWFLLTRLEFPDLDVERYRRKLDAMAADLDPMLRGAGDLEALRIVRKYVHFDKEFRGNVEGYYDPENSYLNCVLDRGLGIPITLSSLYLLLARRVGLPIEGIAAPGHFLLRYRRDRAGLAPVYVDAFHGGRLLTREECAAFLRSLGHVVRGELETRADHREILARMCRNLIAAYGAAGPAHKGERLARWVDILAAGIRKGRGGERE
ncbi:MAG: transglutaminase family protein [Nitrospinota bacterium]